MDHKAFLKSLSPEVKDSLTRKSDTAGLWHLAGHAGLILILNFKLLYDTFVHGF